MHLFFITGSLRAWLIIFPIMCWRQFHCIALSKLLSDTHSFYDSCKCLFSSKQEGLCAMAFHQRLSKREIYPVFQGSRWTMGSKEWRNRETAGCGGSTCRKRWSGKGTYLRIGQEGKIFMNRWLRGPCRERRFVRIRMSASGERDRLTTLVTKRTQSAMSK